MSAPVIWQIVPLSRPDCLSLVKRNFERQFYSTRRLCLVANGPRWVNAQAEVLTSGLRPDLLLTPTEHGKPAALNTALEVLRRVDPGGLVAVRDDDDIQMPSDLLECAEVMRLSGADVVSRHKHWVACGPGLSRLWLLGEHLRSREGDAFVSGGSLLFRNTTDLPLFPDMRVGECVRWAQGLVDSGARVQRPSVNHQVFIRGRDDHLFAAPERQMVRIYARAPKARLYQNLSTETRNALVRGALHFADVPHTIVTLRDARASDATP